jgi:hypothetical protein
VAADQAPPTSRIVIEFSPEQREVPRIGFEQITPYQMITAAWELEQQAQLYRAQAAMSGQAQGLVRAAGLPGLDSSQSLADLMRRATHGG